MEGPTRNKTGLQQIPRKPKNREQVNIPKTLKALNKPEKPLTKLKNLNKTEKPLTKLKKEAKAREPLRLGSLEGAAALLGELAEAELPHLGLGFRAMGFGV